MRPSISVTIYSLLVLALLFSPPLLAQEETPRFAIMQGLSDGDIVPISIVLVTPASHPSKEIGS